MAFVNALLDPIADTLVVTALGGAEQIPFLSLYGVLPASFVFVIGEGGESCLCSPRAARGSVMCCFGEGCR